jgi:PhzF family phenazine biosynthesis protein
MHVLSYTAFSQHPAGGRPVAVVLDATGLDSGAMQAIAAEVGCAKTAFLFPVGDDDFVVRYFSPVTETSFCAQATLAAAVAHGERHGVGSMTLHTWLSQVDVTTTLRPRGEVTAVLTGAPTRMLKPSEEDLALVLAALGLGVDDLDPALPPWLASAGTWHLVLAVRERGLLDVPAADLATLRGLLSGRGCSSVNLVWRAAPTAFWCRNPFLPGRTGEDAATGAAALALGGYLRSLDAVPRPATVTVFEGDERGRTTQLTLGIPGPVGSGISLLGSAIERPVRVDSSGSRVLVGQA